MVTKFSIEAATSRHHGMQSMTKQTRKSIHTHLLKEFTARLQRLITEVATANRAS